MASNNSIGGWTPKTDNLLGHHQNKNYDDERSCRYDIIDHAFPTYPSDVLNELKVNGWLDDIDRGTKGKLQPAKTKVDIDVSNLLQSFNANPLVDDKDKMSNNNSNDASVSSIRGDKSAFISRNERMENTFPEKYPFISKLISSIESTACNRLGKKDASSNADIQYFDFDTSLTSVQIAQYPGDAMSGYPRHCDRGAKCMKEDNMNSTNTKAERLLTFVYYLTPSDWDSELDGGALRMFLPSKQETASNTDTHVDITPHSDRLLVFRSDMIEHEVMPSLRRDRIAITVWLYGKIVHENIDHVNPAPNDLIVTNSSTQITTSLPPPLPTSSDDNQDDIIVLIPSYRDKETWPTIKSLIETARYPHRVYIGVAFQVDTTSKVEVAQLTTEEGSGISIDSAKWNRQKQLRTITMDYRHATGPCYARYLAQSLHRGEEYVLQIDSHMRFRMNWDTFLTHQLNKTKHPEKSVLTAYPPGYESLEETRATILVPLKFGNDGMLRQRGRLLRSDYKHDKENDNIPCLLYAGGFSFSHSSVIETCPYEKHHDLFFGEEISMAVRLYTHGIDLYAPPQTVCYHKWERNPLRVREDVDSLKTKHMKESLNAVRMQLQGQGSGLGTVRSIKQFSEKLGVDFDKQVLYQGCEDVGLSDDAFVSQTTTSLLPNVKEEGLGSNADMNTVLKLVGEYMKGA